MIKEKIKVILVEDDTDILEYIVSLLIKNNELEIVKTFNNFDSAKNEIKEIYADVAVVDIHLDRSSGIDLVKEIKPELMDLQFIMYTALYDAETVFAALKAGATGYLTKETPPQKLADAIIDAYNGGSPMSSDIARKIVKSFHQIEKNKINEQLSKRENEIIYMLADGLRYKEIADKLFLSTETVRKHIRNIYEKLHVNSRTDALNKFF
ncbi:MAG: response regulator transcription factor [Bacteroidia bacterium]|nr:response regulator transcription factor [Bacteroidia bacterium]